MSAVMPFIKIDSDSLLARYFAPYQIAWILAEDPFHEAKKPVFALAEKSVRIGWTFCDGFKNVRKRLRFKNRDYLFATKDLPSALEYMKDVYNFAETLGYTRAVLSHGEDFIKVKSLDPQGNPSPLTEEVKIGYIKFQNGSRIIAFSSNPYAMAVYGGDVGLDEFAKHPNAQLLWQTAQGRVTWGGDLAVWSSHDGEDTLFNQFAHAARATAQRGDAANPLQTALPALPASLSSPPAIPDPTIPNSEISNPEISNPGHSAFRIPHSPFRNPHSEISNPDLPPAPLPPPCSRPMAPSSALPAPSSLWNLYFRVTMRDAVELGLVDIINSTRNTDLTPQQFLSDCRARAGSEEVFEQSYMCNPMGAATANIVEWSAIERCRADSDLERLHLESEDIPSRFGQFSPASRSTREDQIARFLHQSFPELFALKDLRLGFDVAASGQGDLAAFYIDKANGNDLWLRALLTCRTEDWHFLKTVLFCFLQDLRGLRAAGDESGLGRQICWEAAKEFSSRFTGVNLAAAKHDLGFALMNQLATAQKRFPRSQHDIAADFFALRKVHTGTRWVFTEGRNSLNAASHCDIAWAAALASHAHSQLKARVSVAVGHETCWFDGRTYRPYLSRRR